MHGGATGSGAQAGNRNALKHGRYTRELIEFAQRARAAAREVPRSSSWFRRLTGDRNTLHVPVRYALLSSLSTCPLAMSR